MLATLKRLYLYTALTIAIVALWVALISLITLALEAAGLREGALSPETVRGNLSIAIAILIFAMPIAAFHLWLIHRSLGTAAEATCWPRHLYLNAWVVIGLAAGTGAAFAVLQFLIVGHDRDVAASQIATLIVTFLTAAAAWRWRETTPRDDRVWELVGAFATMAIAIALAGSQVYAVAGFVRDRYLSDGRLPPDERGWAAVANLLVALITWAIGFRWQAAWRTVRFRHVYATALYGLGLALFAGGLVQQLAPLLAAGRGEHVLARSFTDAWQPLSVGLLLAVIHGSWLLWDRGRFAQPARVTDRLLSGPAAIVGLAVLVAGWVAACIYVSEVGLGLGDGFLSVGKMPLDVALAAGAVGLATYPLAWWRFATATKGEPRSALRRGYLFGVIAVSLAATVVAGSLAAFWAVSLALGTSDPRFVTSAVEAGASAVGTLAILGVHTALLWSDLRRAGPVERPATADPLVELLEKVAAGRVPVPDAAARIQGMGIAKP